jgi:hypothetical protein
VRAGGLWVRGLRLACLALALWLAMSQAPWGKPVQAQAPQAYRIVINVAEHRLYLYQGDRLFKSYPVAVGKPNTPSPRGEFAVIQKAVWGDGFGTRWMRFSAPWGIYGIHGTNRPWTVGTVASHGCFRMFNRDVEEVYRYVHIGTPVVIEGPTPYAAIRRSLAVGALGQDVVELQRLLRLAKVYDGPLDGIYGGAVQAAVERFQAASGLPLTGVADAATVQRLQTFTGEAGKRPRYLSVDPKTSPARR